MNLKVKCDNFIEAIFAVQDAYREFPYTKTPHVHLVDSEFNIFVERKQGRIELYSFDNETHRKVKRFYAYPSNFTAIPKLLSGYLSILEDEVVKQV